MNKRRASVKVASSLLIFSLIGSIGCGKKNSSDAGAREDAAGDGSMNDLGPIDGPGDGGSGPDTGPGDGGPSDGEPSDGGPNATCPSTSVIDLNMAGTRTGTGATTHYQGNNSAPPVFQLPAPSCQADTSDQIIFRYTPRATTRLRISTNYAPTEIETVAWALDQCAEEANELGCNDGDGRPPHEAAATFTAEGTAGRALWIIVGGYVDMGTASVGVFDLGVTELLRVNRGAPCDPTERSSYCEAASSCLSAGAGPPACVADGGLNGRCRTTGAPCEMNLGCNGDLGNPTSRCVPSVGPGMPCDPLRRANVCAPPNQCVTEAGASTCQPPDYSESELTAAAFIDACASGMRVTAFTGSRAMGHAMTPLPLPFPFTFFGTAETQVWPDVAGYLVFGATAPLDIVEAVLPEVGEGGAIGAFWGRITLRSSPGSEICYAVSGTAPGRTFTIEWLDARAEGAIMPANTHLTFEIVLHEQTHDIDLLYQRLASDPGDETSVNGEDVAIGLQSAMGKRFIAHTGAVATTTGVRFTP